jgi:hypothetical protein
VPGEAAIITLGDSLTYGSTVSAGQVWPRQLAGMLGEPVYNMAFPGWGRSNPFSRSEPTERSLAGSLLLGGGDGRGYNGAAVTPGTHSARWSLVRSPLWPVVVGLVLFLGAAISLLGEAERLDYDTDEGQKIAAAQYFELAFLHGILSGPAWDETYWTMTQPPLTRYILGAGIWLSGNPVPRLDLGHRIAEVRGPNREHFWDRRTYTQDREQLDRERLIERPQSAVLAAARVPMALLGAGAIVLMFLLGRMLAGTGGGLVAALGLLGAPVAREMLPRAHAEAPLLFFGLLGLLLAVRAATATREAGHGPAEARYPRGRDWVFGVGAGLASGLAAAAKLPGALGVVALGLFAAWSALVQRWTPPGVAYRSVQWSLCAFIVGAVAFVSINPFLWPNPVGRSLAMLDFRRQETFGQRLTSAKRAVPDGLDTRLTLLLQRTFVVEPPLARWTGVPFDAGLALLGAGALGLRAARVGRAGLVGPEACVLVWCATTLLGTAPNLALDWQRYYLPTVALAVLLAGVGADAIFRVALSSARLPRRAPRLRPAPG